MDKQLIISYLEKIETIDTLTTQIEQAKEAAQAIVRDCRAEISELQAQTASAREALNEALTQLSATRQTVEEARIEIETLKARVQELEARPAVTVNSPVVVTSLTPGLGEQVKPQQKSRVEEQPQQPAAAAEPAPQLQQQPKPDTEETKETSVLAKLKGRNDKKKKKAQEEPVIEAKPEVKSETKPETKPEPKETIADSIHTGASLADRLSHNVDTQTVASAINAKPITRIQEAISIADRFLFQRELFQGNGAKMSDTIDELNDMQSFDEATAYIERNFNWDSDKEAVTAFLNIVRRRFIK